MHTAQQSEKNMAASQSTTLTLELTTPVDDARPVYITGTFNDWLVDDARFKMERVAAGKFFFTFPKNVKITDKTEYKYIRGGWENQELDAFGNTTQNRKMPKLNSIITDFVPRWSNYGLTFSPKFLPKIEVISEHFEMPQLKKKRRVVALLPYDYAENAQKRYPVLYLQDAQNLFDKKSPYGNWAVDKKLAVLAERGMGDIIVIAIDHGGSERINEFLPPIPTSSGKMGRSEGRGYVNFIAKNLKKHIDEHYRTLPERQHTGIGGSSMGGLITVYAGLMYPNIFGKLMIFSPSLWAVNAVAFDTIHFFQPIPTRIYAYAGGKEGSNMVPNVSRFFNTIKQKGLDASQVLFKISIDPDGEHNEIRWGQEFPKAIEWLFFS